MEAVVSPVLQRNVAPATPLAVSNELPQLFTTVTVGAAGIVFGAAVPKPNGLVHPLTVWVTPYAPALVTVMDDVVAPLLQRNVAPVAGFVTDNTELPQLFRTPTIGVGGIGLTVMVT